VQLRQYQLNLIHNVRVGLRAHNSVLLQSATGSGKTVIATNMLKNASEKGNRSFFVVHRQELVDQTAETFNEAGLNYGIIASGYTPNPIPNVQICSIQTLKNKLDIVKTPTLIIFDEAHHCVSSSWRVVKDYFKDAKIIGLTATPCRLDGKGLKDIFDKIILGPPVPWLMENINPDTNLPYLADYKLYCPNTPDLAGIKTIAGDYDKKEISLLMDNNMIIGDAIGHYKKLADGKRAIIFCAGIEHSKHTAEQFNAAGYPAAHLDGCISKEQRREVIRNFKEGKIKILSNVDIVGEGFNVPSVEVCIMLRPTKSLTIYLQQVGRCLRPEPGKKHAIILDHAGNSLPNRHGLPDDERDWVGYFNGTKKRKKDDIPADRIISKMCDKCYCVHKPAPKCPDCGNIYIVVSRELEQVDGDLIEIDKNLARQARLKEQSEAKTLDQLIELGKKRGYKDSWAHNLFNFRQAKQQQYFNNK
jgi:DNA repair protein RadD